MALIAPPVKPVGPVVTDQTSRRYFTLHTGPNTAFTLRTSEEDRTSIVGFIRRSDAYYVSQMLETKFLHEKEWLTNHGGTNLILPSPSVRDLSLVAIHEWDFDDLKILCTSNFMDMISVDEIVSNDDNHVFSGHKLKFEAPLEFYQVRLENLVLYS